MYAPRVRSHDFGALEAELVRLGEAAQKDHWAKDRVFKVETRPGCLTLSWSGDTEYEIALAAKKKSDEAEAALIKRSGPPRGRPVSQKQLDEEKLRAALAVRAAHPAEEAGRYAYSVYVFYKSDEGPPPEIALIDPGLASSYRDAPLHHYLILSRRQALTDSTTAPPPGPWTAEKPTFATRAALTAHMMGRVFPPQCPRPPRVEPPREINRPLLSAVAAAGIVIALGLAAWFAFARADSDASSLAAAPPPGPAAAQAAPPAPDGRLAALEGGIEDLRAEFNGLRRDVAALTAGGAAPADFTATARALDSLAERLADASSAPASIAPGGGLDRPPCLPVREVEGRVVPEYLFTAVLSDAGITALPRPSRPDGPDLSPYQARFGALGQTVSAETFRARAAPVLTAQPDCRHYALLVEEAMSSAALYAAQRQAVEDHFYIFRLQP